VPPVTRTAFPSMRRAVAGSITAGPFRVARVARLAQEARVAQVVYR
jgi:hypothetical protein